ncbi:hypothetical protein CPB97_005809, partial [Podila verticillata]
MSSSSSTTSKLASNDDILHLFFERLNTQDIHSCAITCKNWNLIAVQKIFSWHPIIIGNPNREMPFPNLEKWNEFNQVVKYLTIGSAADCNSLIKYSMDKVTMLRKLHVMNHMCLDIPSNNNSSASLSSASSSSVCEKDPHWLKEVAVNNQGLRVMSLISRTPVNISIPRADFKISTYFGSPVQTNLPALTSLKLRYFSLTPGELANLLNFCPQLTRLELEHVWLDSDELVAPPELQVHAGRLQYLSLLCMDLKGWFVNILGGVQTLVLKGHLQPAAAPATQGIKWKVPRSNFDTMMTTMRQLQTLKLDRVGIVGASMTTELLRHQSVQNVFTTEEVDFGHYFPHIT